VSPWTKPSPPPRAPPCVAAAPAGGAGVHMAPPRVEALPVGSGRLDLGLMLRGGTGAGILGALVDYEHRFSKTTSAFAEGMAGAAWDDTGRRWQAEAITGLRMRF
jgi:hypothetical protein